MSELQHNFCCLIVFSACLTIWNKKQKNFFFRIFEKILRGQTVFFFSKKKFFLKSFPNFQELLIAQKQVSESKKICQKAYQTSFIGQKPKCFPSQNHSYLSSMSELQHNFCCVIVFSACLTIWNEKQKKKFFFILGLDTENCFFHSRSRDRENFFFPSQNYSYLSSISELQHNFCCVIVFSACLTIWNKKQKKNFFFILGLETEKNFFHSRSRHRERKKFFFSFSVQLRLCPPCGRGHRHTPHRIVVPPR